MQLSMRDISVLYVLNNMYTLLVQLRKGHRGIRKYKARAQEAVWWPAFNVHITAHVENCEARIKQRFQLPEPLQPSTPPTLPWQKLAIDLCGFKQQCFLIIVDYFSRFIDVQLMHSTTFTAVIKALCNLFATYDVRKRCLATTVPSLPVRNSALCR